MPTDPTNLEDILPAINLPYEHDNEDEDLYDDEYGNFDEVEEEEGLNPETPNIIPENCLHHETGEILKNPIHIHHIGWFESNDPRIKNDFMSFNQNYEHCKIIDDKKYNKFYTLFQFYLKPLLQQKVFRLHLLFCFQPHQHHTEQIAYIYYP